MYLQAHRHVRVINTVTFPPKFLDSIPYLLLITHTHTHVHIRTHTCTHMHTHIHTSMKSLTITLPFVTIECVARVTMTLIPQWGSSTIVLTLAYQRLHQVALVCLNVEI